MSTKKTKETSTPIHPFIVGSLLVTGVWLGSILLLNLLFGDSHNEKAAWFGDSFGGVNSLFSGLAFAGIIYTILLQRKELQLQREELAETREVLKRSAEAQEKSEKAFNKQIEIMGKSAVINAHATIIDFKGVEYSITKSPQAMADHREVAYDLMRKLTDISNDISQELNNNSNTESHT